MKKFIIFICVFLVFLSVPIQADTKVKYRIYMDSSETNTYARKEEVIAILDELCDQVAKDSYATMVSQNISMFEQIENSKTKWKNNTVYIYMGDAKGSLIKGSYEKNNVCMKEVKPKSKIVEWLGMD